MVAVTRVMLRRGRDCTARAPCDHGSLGWTERATGTECLTETLPMTLVLANILAVISGLLGALFLLGVLSPRRLIVIARGFIGGTGVAGAVVVRLLLAALLWFSSPVASTPTAFRMLGVVMVVAAAGALVLGKDRVATLADRMAGWPPAVVRLPIAIGLALCAFMLWSISPAIGEF